MVFPRRLVPPELVWDSAARTLNGVSLPSPPSSLVPFGPCEQFRSLGGHCSYLDYPSLGLEIELGRGRIRQIALFFAEDSDTPRPGLVPARLRVDPAGTVLGSGVGMEGLAALLGPERGRTSFDDGEEILYFRDGDICFDATFTKETGLTCLEIYNDIEE